MTYPLGLGVGGAVLPVRSRNLEAMCWGVRLQ